MDLKKEIEEYLENLGLNIFHDPVQKTHPKIKRSKEIHANIFKSTDFLPEGVTFSQRLWHIFNMPEGNNICENGNIPKFDSFFRGYFVGCKNECSCVIKRKEQGPKDYYKGISKEEKNAILEKRTNTNLENMELAIQPKPMRSKNKLKTHSKRTMVLNMHHNQNNLEKNSKTLV